MQQRYELKRLASHVRVAKLSLKDLLKLTNDFRWDLRGAVCEQLGELTGLSEKDVDTITDRMLVLADDMNWYVKRAAWRTLGKLNLSDKGQIKVFNRVKKQVQNICTIEREFAYKILEMIPWKGKIKNRIHQPKFFKWLRNKIKDEPHPEVFIAGLWLLKTLLPADDLNKNKFCTILSKAHSHRSCEIREAMYQILGTVEWPVSLMLKVADTLKAGIDDEISFVSSAACKSLINLSWTKEISSDLAQIFLEYLQLSKSKESSESEEPSKPKAALRELACEALGKWVLSSMDNINYALVFKEILALTSDDVPSVRSLAWKTLAKYLCSDEMQSVIFDILEQSSKPTGCPWHLLMDYYQILGEFPWSKEIKAEAKELLTQAEPRVTDPYLKACVLNSLKTLNSNTVTNPLNQNQTHTKLSSFWDRFFISKVDLKTLQPENSLAYK